MSAIREFPYVDEYATLSQANLPISELLQQNATFWNGEYWGQFWDVAHPSLYYILFKYWIGFGEILGISSLHFAHFARLPSLFAYILTSIFLWKIAKKIGNHYQAYFVISFFAFHTFWVDLGAQARMYPLTFLFIILSLYFLIQSLSQPKKTFFLPSLFAALAFYSDYSTIWFIFSLLISVLILSRYSSIFHKYKSTLIKMLAATFLFITPQLVIFITNIFSAVQLQDWLQQYSLIQLVCNSGHQFMGIFQPNSIIIYGLYWIFLLFLLSSCIRHIPQSTSIKKFFFLFLAISFLLPILSLLSISIITGTILYQPRNMMLSTLLPLFTSSLFFSHLIEKSPPKNQNAWVVLTLLLPLLSYLVHTFSTPEYAHCLG